MAASESSATGTCPECDGAVATEGTERVCAECGLVVDADEIDRGPEWRAIADDADERSRVGAPSTERLHDKGLRTEIGYDDNGLSSSQRNRVKRIRRQHTFARWQGKLERKRSEAFGEVDRMASALGVDEERREQACRLFRSAQDENLLLGRSLEGVAAACIYAVARVNHDPLVLEDVVTVARVDAQRIRRAYWTIDRELGIPAPPPRPQTYVARVCDDLDLGADVRRRAEEFVDVLESSDAQLSGRAPTGIAAACVYRAGREERGAFAPSQDDVAAAANSCDHTLRDRLEQLRDAQEAIDDV